MYARRMFKPIALAILLFGAVSSARAATTGGDAQAAALAAAMQDPSANPPSGTAVTGEAGLIRAVYDRVDWALLWSTAEHSSDQARELAAILRAADDYGLRPNDYAADLIATLAARTGDATTLADRARFDLLLTRSAVRLISHLHYGRIDPRAAGFELSETRSEPYMAATVAALATAASVGAAVAAAEPPFYHYMLLKAALLRYRGLAADPTLTRLPAFRQRTLHPGDAYAGAPALRRLLIAEGDLPGPGDAADEDQTLDPGLVQGLARFQDRHGLSADGSLGATTFAALTTPMVHRVRQIELTLERWRWLPPFDTPPIIVNIPEFRLFAFTTTTDRAASLLQMPVIVGQTYPSKRTPIFVGDLKYVVFRPYWDIPRSITLHEMLPAMRAQPDYLQRNNLEIVRGDSDESPVVAPSPQALDALAAGELRLRQRPGEDNALGLIKFLFPNAHNVYMHSTPAHRLFLASRRAFSHGCIRVSDPMALALYVLRNAGTPWDAGQIDAAMHGTQSLRVELHVPIHVMILYGTAMATEGGPVQFFDDIYGHDRKLAALLGLPPA